MKQLVAVAALLLTGCGATPMVVNLQDSESAIVRTRNASPAHIEAVVIDNLAQDGKLVHTAIGSDTLLPINTAEPIRATVALDIQRYFQSVTKTRVPGPKVVVRIEQAEAYWVLGGVEKVPFVGLFTVGADREFFLNLRVVFEVEEGGKVAKSYTFAERISLPDGKGATSDDVMRSYQRLVELYRRRFFDRLDAEFTHRYL